MASSSPSNNDDNDNDVIIPIDDSILQSDFANNRADKPLRVCCYGSSSSSTPETYLSEARHVGYLLAVRGHTCVNGAGSFGCMAGLNEGAAIGNGHIVGVIHEMWLVDDHWTKTTRPPLRDGGAHPVFETTSNNSNDTTAVQPPIQQEPPPPQPPPQQSHGGPHPALKPSQSSSNNNNNTSAPHNHPIREMLVAGGNDLQERKRLLVEKADALIVLPGGPGTWDELWEMACARNIGLTQLPIVCVNVKGYYDAFQVILQRAYQDGLTKLEPHEIVHFEKSAEAAVKWIEDVQHTMATPKVRLQKRPSTLRKASFMSDPILPDDDNDVTSSSWWKRSIISRATSWATDRFVSFRDDDEKLYEDYVHDHDNDDVRGEEDDNSDAAILKRLLQRETWMGTVLIFGTGVVVGILVGRRRR